MPSNIGPLDSRFRRNDDERSTRLALLSMPILAWAVALALILLATACGPSDAELDVRIQQAVDAAVSGTAPPDLNVVYQQVWPAVFYIEPEDGQHGTGWLLEPGVIATAAHVVSGNAEVTVRQAAAPAFVAAVAGMDERRDVALLWYDAGATQLGAGAAPLVLGDADIYDIAKELLALGYSGSGVKGDGEVGSPKANAGILSQITNFGAQSYGRNLEMDAPIDPGDSGGPVLNTAGEVVGMVRAAARRTPGGGQVVGTFYAVHADEIRAAVEGIRSRGNPAPQQ